MTYIIISFINQQLNDRQNKQQFDSFFIHHGQEITRKRILNNHIKIFIREMIVKMTKRKLNKHIEPNANYDKHSQGNARRKNELI